MTSAASRSWCSLSSAGQGVGADLLLALDEHRDADRQVVAEHPERAEVGDDAGLVVGGAAARRAGRRARSARTAASPSRRGRSRAGRRGGRRAARSARPPGPALCAITAGAPPSALTISTQSKFSARNSSATASALRCTSPARAGSALTDSIRTRSSRSFRMPGSTAWTFARISSLMEVNLATGQPASDVRCQPEDASRLSQRAGGETGRRARRWRGPGRRTRRRPRRARRWRGRSRCRRRSRRRRAGCRGCAGRPRRPATAAYGGTRTSTDFPGARSARSGQEVLGQQLAVGRRALGAGECLRDGGRVGRAQAGGHAPTLVTAIVRDVWVAVALEIQPKRLGLSGLAEPERRRPAAAARSRSSAGSSMVKSASTPARVISGQSRVSVFMVIRQPPSTGSMVAQLPTRAVHHLGRYGEPHPHGVPHRHGGDPGPHELQRVLGGQLARAVARAGQPGLADPVDAEAAPVLAVAVVADEVPPATERDQPVRLDVPLGLAPPRARCRRSAPARRRGSPAPASSASPRRPSGRASARGSSATAARPSGGAAAAASATAPWSAPGSRTPPCPGPRPPPTYAGRRRSRPPPRPRAAAAAATRPRAAGSRRRPRGRRPPGSRARAAGRRRGAGCGR